MFCKQLDAKFEESQRRLDDQDLTDLIKSKEQLSILKEFLTSEEIKQIVSYHYQLSRGCGMPVGMIKLYTNIPKGELSEFDDFDTRFHTESLYDRMKAQIASLYEKHTLEMQFESDFDSFSLKEETKERKKRNTNEDEIEQIDLEGKIV